jgi:hypothetical protein
MLLYAYMKIISARIFMNFGMDVMPYVITSDSCVETFCARENNVAASSCEVE